MKVHFTLLFLTLAFSQTVAQLPTHFAPIGTRWEYNYYLYGQENGKYVYESVGDTLINGVTHRIIKESRKVKCDYPEPICAYVTTVSQSFLTVRNDSLLAATPTGYNFLFNFGYRIGDSVHITGLPSGSPRAVVTRIADTLFNGKKLKFWEISHICPLRTYHVGKPRIINVFELVGTDNYGWFEFREKCNSDPVIKSLCSISSGGWEYSRGVCIYSVPTNEVFDDRKLSVYPNPAKSQIRIDFEGINRETQGDIRLVDLMGQTVFQKKLDASGVSLPNGSGSAISIDVSALPVGMYQLVFLVKNKLPMVQKVAIMR